VETGITWYDVLGVLPGASVAEIAAARDGKARLLRPELLAGAPSTVVRAARRAETILDRAWWVLGDPARRTGYDVETGILRTGGGLERRENIPSESGLGSSDFDGGRYGAALLGGLLMLADAMAPHARQPSRVAVPELRGLFYSTCPAIVARLGLRVTAVRLTAHPMPVDGLVVDQSLAAQTKARRATEITVQVWHPAQTRA